MVMTPAYFLNICNRHLRAYHADFYLLFTHCFPKPNSQNGASSVPAIMPLWALQSCSLKDFECSPLQTEYTVEKDH